MINKQCHTHLYFFSFRKLFQIYTYDVTYTSLYDTLSVFAFPKNQSFDCGIYSIAYQHAVYDWPVWVPVRTQKAIKKEKKAEENPRHGIRS
jgi:hypothetical protein